MSAQPSRRLFLRGTAFATAAFVVPGVFAEELAGTPRQTEGPFYPDKLPLDTDNDLLILNDSITPGVGQIAHLSGRILGPTGKPIRNAVVEIWQVDNKGAYLHSRGSSDGQRDTNFQGFGRFLTGSKGEYYFRTIKPVAYPGRTPHIHFAINQGGKRMLTTQLYIKGEPANERDGLFNRVRDPKARALLLADFKPLPDSKIDELGATFDIVIGATPEDPAQDGFRRRREAGGRQPR